jgi:hypothetical protein
MHTVIFFCIFFVFFNKHKNESLFVFSSLRREKLVSEGVNRFPENSGSEKTGDTGKFRFSLTEESDGHLLLDVGALEDFAELLEGDEGVLKT